MTYSQPPSVSEISDSSFVLSEFSDVEIDEADLEAYIQEVNILVQGGIKFDKIPSQMMFNFSQLRLEQQKDGSIGNSRFQKFITTNFVVAVTARFEAMSDQLRAAKPGDFIKPISNKGFRAIASPVLAVSAKSTLYEQDYEFVFKTESFLSDLAEIANESEITDEPSLTDFDVANWTNTDPATLNFVVEDLVPIGMVTLLIGEGGVGKTMFMQMLATAIPVEENWIGKKILNGYAVGVFAEDSDLILQERQKRINTALNLELHDLAGGFICRSYVGEDPNFWSSNRPTETLINLEQEISELLSTPRALLIDNSALVFNGDENSRKEVTAFLQYLNAMAQRLNIAIILSTHTSKSYERSPMRSASGSTAWINASRSVLELSKSKGFVSLTLKKANHRQPGEQIELIWENGVLALEASSNSDFQNIQKLAESSFINGLLKITSQNGKLSISKNSSNYAPKKIFRWIKRNDDTKLKIKDLEMAMECLVDEGIIALENRGTRSKPDRHLVLVGDAK
mgnify:CR=1 FL=1